MRSGTEIGELRDSGASKGNTPPAAVAGGVVLDLYLGSRFVMEPAIEASDRDYWGSPIV